MPRITKPLRGRKAKKRLDLTDMRQLFKDNRLWVALATVAVEEGQQQHFEITDECVVVDVVLQPAQEPLRCRLTSTVWRIPAVGDEVLIALPEGKRDFLPVIVANLSAPPTTQGPAEANVVIVGGQVIVHDGQGGAVALAKASELNNLAHVHNSHNHTVTVVTTGSSTTQTGTATTAAPAQTQADQPGTSVLLGK